MKAGARMPTGGGKPMVVHSRDSLVERMHFGVLHSSDGGVAMGRQVPGRLYGTYGQARR